MRRVSHDSGGRSRRPAGWLMFLVATCLAIAACTSSDDVDLESGDAGLGSAASPTESDEDAENQGDSSADETADSVSEGTESEGTENQDDADEPTSESTPAGFVAPVRFENGEHESSEPIDRELVEEKLADASLAAFNNWRSCITLGRECDFERDVAPVLSGSQRVFLGQDLLGYVEGERLIPGDQDNVVVSEVEVIELTPPILGHVFMCVVDTGVQLIEAGDGREEEILNDDFFAYVLGYQIVSDSGGVLTVEGEWNVVPITEDLSLCDEF